MPLVELIDASVAFGSVPAVRGATLSIGRSEFVAVVGPNGSGKTTLLRLLHGVVTHAGQRRTSAEGGLQAMVFQRPFLMRLSARRNVALALWLAARRLPGAERAARVEAALGKVGLWPLRDRAARSLSGGEQQRLALARAWALGPTLLFLDEPTASLDPTAKKEVESVLAAFAAEGTTLVMSTHNLGQAKRLASRVVFMDEGRVALDLPAAVFFAQGGHARADRFVKGELPWSSD
ncbi:MAG: ATP-binding cassette domain-containing protein [Caldimonas sp.]